MKTKHLGSAFVMGIMCFIFLATGTVVTKASFNDTGKSSIIATGARLSTTLKAPSSYIMTPIFYDLSGITSGTTTYSSTSTLTNSGNMVAKYTGTFDAVTDSKDILMSQELQITVQIEGVTVYTGSLKNLNISTQTLAVGQTHTIKMTLSLPHTSNSESLQNHYMSKNIYFKVTQ